VSKRHGSEIKQLSIAIGMARKQSYSFFGREVDVVWWSVAGLGQFGAAVSAMVVANVLCESTVENYYHAGVRPHCRKLVELQKAKAASHAAWSSVKCDEATDVMLKGLGMPIKQSP